MQQTSLAPINQALLAREMGPGVPWRVALDAYLSAAIDSENTRTAYRFHIARALERIGRETLASVSGMDLAAFRAELLQDGRAPATHHQALAALRSFLKWARQEHVGACQLSRDTIEEALRMPRATVKRPYQILTNPEQIEVRRQAKTARDRALLAVMLGAALRVSEAVGLDVSDLREHPAGGLQIHVRRGKGAKDRIAPLEAQDAEIVLAYLGETGRTITSEGPLFRAHDRGAGKRERRRITARAAHDVVSSAVTRAGITGKVISPHSLRHTFSIFYLRNGGTIEKLQKILGHASIATTQRYADHFEFDELMASMPVTPK